ncbi:hypothetical protein ACLBXO_29100 [Methylobacterium sp. C33D]
MPFQFTDAQWLSLSSAIINLGGNPSCEIRKQLETDIGLIFTRPDDDDEMVKALRRVRDAAYELAEALTGLAHTSGNQAHRHDWLAEYIIANDVEGRLKLAKKVRECAEGADWTLDKGYGAHNEVSRGRPTDTARLSWISSVLRVAMQAQWTTEDHLGRTSPAFMDLVVELAGCATAAGLTHSRDRRSLIRSMARAREEERKDRQAGERIRAELDALGRS